LISQANRNAANLSQPASMVARRILPALPGVAETLNTGGALLEAGCGTGNLQLQIAKAFPSARCTGIDIDPTGLAAAREEQERRLRDAGLAGPIERSLLGAGFTLLSTQKP
jgi:ubiquinone/menaquinone biosynthesis C-methylase UbiE